MSSTQTLQVPGYQVIRFLGSGARSTIWQVRDQRTDEVYALKRVVKRNSGDTRFLEQAVNEYRVGAQFNHPAIRRIFEIRRIKRWLRLREIHLMMELCEGKTVQENRPKTLGEATRLFAEVAAALAYMNSRGFVHADTKPNNIIVSPEDKIKLIDFGQSCPIGTVKSRIQGTPDFIAPEQVRRHPIDARTDVYNFGATLYWTLTNRPIPTVLPKEGQLRMNDAQRVTPPQQLNPDVPGPLAKLVTDCVELHPANRPASLNEVASRLSLIARQLERNGPKGR